MSSLQVGVEKGNVMKLIIRTAKRKKRALNIEAYVNRKNRQILKKTMKDGCGEKCRMRCQDRIGKDHRETVFNYFWHNGTFTKGEVKRAPTWKSRAKRQGARRA